MLLLVLALLLASHNFGSCCCLAVPTRLGHVSGPGARGVWGHVAVTGDSGNGRDGSVR
jgi:hypothetical protein